MKRLILAVAGICVFSAGLAQTNPGSLRAGDILYLDSGDAIAGAYVVKLDALTGQQTIIVSHLNSPEGIAVDHEGKLMICSGSAVMRIDPETGGRELVADVGKFGSLWGLALSEPGDAYASFMGGRLLGPHRYYFTECDYLKPKFKVSSGILKVTAASGSIKCLSSGHLFQNPTAVAVGDGGDVFVCNIAFPGKIIRVSSKGGPDRVVSSGSLLHFPLGIVVSGRYAYVTDVATEDQNFGIGTIVCVDVETGTQRLVSAGNNLLKPVGIALDPGGQLIVTDPYTINPNSSNLYDGGIIRIDPVSGAQTLLARGQGNIINPLAVTVVR